MVKKKKLYDIKFARLDCFYVSNHSNFVSKINNTSFVMQKKNKYNVHITFCNRKYTIYIIERLYNKIYITGVPIMKTLLYI